MMHSQKKAMLLEMKGKVKFLMKLLKNMKENQLKIKTVVLKLLERNDGKTKQKISKMVGEGEVKGARGQTWKKQNPQSSTFFLDFPPNLSIFCQIGSS